MSGFAGVHYHLFMCVLSFVMALPVCIPDSSSCATGLLGKALRVLPLRSAHTGLSCEQASVPMALRGGACYMSNINPDDHDDDHQSFAPSRSNWKRRVLVTGGCGFMGSYLVDRLVSRYPDYLIVVLDVLDECGSLEHLVSSLGHPNCIFVRGDIRDELVVSNILAQHSIDAVLHLAAQTSVDHSFKDPAVFTQAFLSLSPSLPASLPASLPPSQVEH